LRLHNQIVRDDFRKQYRRLLKFTVVSVWIFFNGCAKVTLSPTLHVKATDNPIATTTQTITPTPTYTSTMIPTMTETITPTLTYTLTLTPTSEFPIVEVNVQAAHCRYGPSRAFLHAADLYEEDRGVVQGRFQYSDWLYVKWDKIEYRCWVSPYVVDVIGEIDRIGLSNIGLERIPSTLYSSPTNVRANREGEIVTIHWDRVAMTEDDDRGYLIEAFICQEGAYFWWTARIELQCTTTYTVQDDASCPFPSSGKIYTVEKHGYTSPVTIPWPP